MMQQKSGYKTVSREKQLHKRALWQRVVSLLVSITVFITTYALILPALTLEKDVICGIEEHIHEASCFSQEDASLICAVSEHTHGDICYALEEVEENIGIQYLCGSGDHIHSELCADENGTVICSIPEHTHDASCVVEDYDPEADIETVLQWEATMGAVQMSGNWPRDAVKIAATQLGYTESAKNVVLSENGLEGYSRYGQWYGEPYGDWNIKFAAFVLNYAGVDVVSRTSSASEMRDSFIASDLFKDADGYIPKAGDIIFIDPDRANDPEDESPRSVERVAVITEVSPEKMTVIEGDVNGKVEYSAYSFDDASIVGYGYIPSGDLMILEHSGEDYKVTVEIGKDAMIPETVLLDVREIEPGTEEYETYYVQSVSTLFGESSAETEEELGVSFARFFDISFMVDGVKTEPAAPVDIRISYDESFSMDEDDVGVAVHFASEGIEIIDALTTQSDEEGTDTFEFTQNSFSVTGTVVSNNARAANAYQKVPANSIDSSGRTQYVIYTVYGDRYFAINGNGGLTEIRFAADGKTVSTDVQNNILWKFTEDGNNFFIQNSGTNRYLHAYSNSGGTSAITSTKYSSALIPVSTDSELAFKIKSNSDYTYVVRSGSNYSLGVTQENQGQAEAAQYYLAAIPASSYHVWFDGTNGGLMALYGSPNEYRSVSANSNTITLPSEWESPTKYSYKLNGWYDIVNHKHYEAGEQVTIESNTVFYADWVAESYDVGFENEHSVDSLDTNNFITTYVFDYNVLFNALSLAHSGSITASGHKETWNLITNGEVPYSDGDGDNRSIGFSFLDYDASGDISYANGRDGEQNYNRNVITPGILEYVNDLSGEDLVDLLFNPDTKVIGKNYVGKGNYLFQYMDSTTPNYDGHDGYYYFHSRLNAASYNQTEQRFYLYDYLERTSDSWKDGGPGEYSDFLPFNSPYANIPEGQRLPQYLSDDDVNGYMFDAKDDYTQNGTRYSSTANAGTNYLFGIRSDIEFFLPNDAGTKDEYNNYGNISTKGQHMVFEFHGDDDLWVFVDGELILDVGGVHGVEYGNIDFSTGYVTSGEGDEQVSKTFTEILGYNITEGTHTLTVYYMERGSSQSNCSIYFNIAPRYTLELTKEDIFTAEKLDGSEFTIYTDEECTHLAQLWLSEADHDVDMDDGHPDNTISTLVVENGVASCWGISAGKTYYIKETKSPDGYPVNDDLIRITLNNRGTATIETTTLNGADGEETEGFAVIKQNVNDTLKIVALTVTNQPDTETTQLRVVKEWDETSVNIPNSIEVYLTEGGKRVGRTATLTEANGWSYKWTGLPKYEADGVTPKVYLVEEVQVEGYETEHISSETYIERIDWIKSEAMADSSTYVLVNSGRALSYDGRNFLWIDPEIAKTDDGINAQWNVTTNQYGFRLTNGSGYNLTYESNEGIEGDYFYATQSTDISLNQVIYFLQSRLVAHDHDYYFQFDEGGDGVSSDGLVFTLYRKDVLTGTLVNIKNTPIEEDKQTHVEVNKVWNDLADHSNDNVVIHLYAKGKDTGRTVTLNKLNNWHGSFDGLPYYDLDGVTPIVYTVHEAEFDGYMAEYSGPVQIPGKSISSWDIAEGLTNGGIYRFVSGSNALSVDMSGNLISAVNDPKDNTQYWQAELNRNTIYLKNVAYGYYLDADNSSVFTAGNRTAASAVVLSNDTLCIGNRYLQITSSSVTSSQNENNGTVFTVTRQSTVTAMPGTMFTVTNSEAAYVLPHTGGEGSVYDSFLRIGGSLTAAVASMYVCEFSCKRRKKEREFSGE